jgi:hypothetical protein
MQDLELSLHFHALPFGHTIESKVKDSGSSTGRSPQLPARPKRVQFSFGNADAGAKPGL